MNVRDAILGRLPEARRPSRGSSLKQTLLSPAPWYLYSSPHYQIWLSTDQETRDAMGGHESIWVGDNPTQPVFGFRDKLRERIQAWSLERLTDAIVAEMGPTEGKAAGAAMAAWIDARLGEITAQGDAFYDALRSQYVNPLCFLDPAMAMRHIGQNFDGYGMNWRDSLLPQNHIALIHARVAPAGSLAAFQNQDPDFVQLNPDDIWLWFHAIDLPAYFPKDAQKIAESLLVHEDLPTGWETQKPYERDMMGYVDDDAWDQIRECLGRFRVESPKGGWVSAKDAISISSNSELVDWIETWPAAEPVRNAVAMAYGDAYDRALYQTAHRAYMDALNDLFDGTMNVVVAQKGVRFTLAYRQVIERLEEYERANGEAFTGDLRDLNVELGYKIETPSPEYFEVRLDDEDFNARLSHYVAEVRPEYDEGQQEFEFDEDEHS